MGSFSDYAEAKILDHVFGGTTWTPPATLYLAVYSVAPTDAGGGTEYVGNGYLRVAVTNNTTNFTNATGTSPTSKTTGTAESLPIVTGVNQPAAVAWGYFDASSGGNLIIWGLFDVAKIDYVGDTLTIAPGGVTITLD